MIVLTYMLLLISVLSVWCFKNKPYSKLFLIPLVGTLLAAYFSNSINYIGVLVIVTLFFLAYLYSYLEKNHKYSRIFYHILCIIIFIFTFLIFNHMLSGFNNLLVLEKIQVSQNAIPFTMYFNLDKVLAGLTLLFLVVPLTLNISHAIKRSWYLSLLTIILIMVTALYFKLVKFDFKLHDYFLIFAINNLFFVSMAEEVLFRGFLQRHLSLLKIKFASLIGILLPAIIFGLFHLKAGVPFMIFATLSGIMYGLVYHRSKSIEVTIFTHFLLNFIHITFFTYPFLIN